MLRLKLQNFGHRMQRIDSLEKTLMLGGIGGQEQKGTTEDEIAGWHHRLDGHEFEQTLGESEGTDDPGGPQSIGLQRVGHDLVTEQ